MYARVNMHRRKPVTVHIYVHHASRQYQHNRPAPQILIRSNHTHGVFPHWCLRGASANQIVTLSSSWLLSWRGSQQKLIPLHHIGYRHACHFRAALISCAVHELGIEEQKSSMRLNNEIIAEMDIIRTFCRQMSTWKKIMINIAYFVSLSLALTANTVSSHRGFIHLRQEFVY